MSVSDQGSIKLNRLAGQVAKHLLATHSVLSVAESCTGGLIAATLTEIAGSSAWFDRGFVTYSNAAKVDMLGVQSGTLELYGAVSEPCALEMAQGVIRNSLADCAIAVTGIAGPTGGSIEKPLGSVYLAWIIKRGAAHCELCHFKGSRAEVRLQSVNRALNYLLAELQSLSSV